MFNRFTIDGEILLEPHNDTYFRIASDFTVKCYSERSGVMSVVVKEGLLTDLGSIPKWVQSLTGIHSRGNKSMTAAFIVHDALFQSQGHLHEFSFDFVNDLLAEMMDELPVGIGSIKKYLVNVAVDLGGKNAWSTFDVADMNTIDNELVSTYWGVK